MRFAALLVALIAASPAHAGGVGLLLHGGGHTENVYYYSNHTEDGAELTDLGTFPQYQQKQYIPQYGAGLEFLLGDRDDKIQGVFRVYYNQDAPQGDPSKNPASGVEADWVVSAYRDAARHTGMASMGLNWGIVGNPNKFQVGLSAHLGSGFLTNDHTEFFNLQLGPTANFRFNRQVIGFVDVHATARFRKEFGFGNQAMAGVRYMFD
jgi:hypothetical protein